MRSTSAILTVLLSGCVSPQLPSGIVATQSVAGPVAGPMLSPFSGNADAHGSRAPAIKMLIVGANVCPAAKPGLVNMVVIVGDANGHPLSSFSPVFMVGGSPQAYPVPASFTSSAVHPYIKVLSGVSTIGPIWFSAQNAAAGPSVMATTNVWFGTQCARFSEPAVAFSTKSSGVTVTLSGSPDAKPPFFESSGSQMCSTADISVTPVNPERTKFKIAPLLKTLRGVCVEYFTSTWTGGIDQVSPLPIMVSSS